MKLRLTIIVAFLSLVITTRALAANKLSQTGSAASLNSVSVVPSPSPTPTETPVVPAITTSTTPSAEISPTPEPTLAGVKGVVSLPIGTSLPQGLKADLLLFDSVSQQIEQNLNAAIQADGSYEFKDIPAKSSTIFLVTVDYMGVTYNSGTTPYDGSSTPYDMPVTLYSTSTDLNLLSIPAVHAIFDFSTPGQVKVTVIYVILNSGQTSIIASSDGTSIPFISIPAGAKNVNYQLDQNSSPLLKATGGFAFLPGPDKQYGIVTSFTLPYSKRMVYVQPFTVPITSATIIVPEGVRVSSDQLKDAKTQVSSGTTYHLDQAASLASGSTLTMTISGMPGDKPGYVLPGGIVLPYIAFDQKTWTVLGAAAIGLILIALGIFLFFRDRMLRRLDDEDEDEDLDREEPETAETDSLGDDRDNILDAILSLDDEFKAGAISKDAYKERRDELKARLKKIP
jgi:hypothetical protein